MKEDLQTWLAGKLDLSLTYEKALCHALGIKKCGIDGGSFDDCYWHEKDGTTWSIEVLDDGTAITWCWDYDD